MRKVHKNQTKTTNQINKNQRNFRQNSAKRNSNRLSTLERESQRKGKLTQKKVNKQKRKTANQCNKNKAVMKF